jgi:hypothetical protein
VIFRSSRKNDKGKPDDKGINNPKKIEGGSFTNEEKSKTVNYEESEMLTQLSSSKTAAIAKMKLYGEEWAEEEELPTSWEAGEGGGADTELGVKGTYHIYMFI